MKLLKFATGILLVSGCSDGGSWADMNSTGATEGADPASSASGAAEDESSDGADSTSGGMDSPDGSSGDDGSTGPGDASDSGDPGSTGEPDSSDTTGDPTAGSDFEPSEGGASCVGANPQAFDASTFVAIPDDATVTSTITVQDVDPYLWRVIVRTELTHERSADLTLMLISPSGTQTVLSSGRGGLVADAFDGTQWRDDAYELASDTWFIEGEPNTALVPEGAMGAFRGEDPNGTWTLQLTDEIEGAIGELYGWSIQVETVAKAPSGTGASPTQPAELPITFGTPVSSRLDVRQSGILCGIAVTTAIAHTAPGELDVWVVAPSGASAALTRRSGGEADNVFNGTHWSDKGQSLATMHDYKNNVLAPSLVPEGALSALVGEEVSGVWSLEIRDRLAGNDGVLGDYTLDLRICECES